MEIIDQPEKENNSGINKYLWWSFGLLDAVSFLYAFDQLMLLNWAPLSLIFGIQLVLILSFLVTAVLFFFRNKLAFTLYFIQFPLRIIFYLPSFIFLTDLFIEDAGSKAALVLGVFIVLMELGRFIFNFKSYRSRIL